MATYTYKNSNQRGVGTGLTTLYTVPAATTTIVLGMSLANALAATIKTTVIVNDGTNDVNILNAVPLAPGATQNPLGTDRWTLPTGYIVKVKSDTASSFDAMLHYVELT